MQPISDRESGTHRSDDYDLLDADQRPATSQARFIVAAWLCSFTILLYLDRNCWAKSAKLIQEEFNFTNTQLSWLMIAFLSAYAIFEIPSGGWGDRFGSRRVITRITICWSVFTMLTVAAFGFWSLFAIRFLFGAGEAGAMPNAARVVASWFPAAERGRAQGVTLGSTLIGGALAPILTALIIERWGWRASFLIFGAVGMVWAFAFWSWFRDSPEKHGWVSATELAHIRSGGGMAATEHQAVPWSLVLSNHGILIHCAIIFATAFNTYFYFSWFPMYLEDGHGQSNMQSGFLSSLPLWGAALGVFVGGYVADRISKTSRSTVAARRLVCSTAMAVAMLSMVSAMRASTAWSVTFQLAVSCFCLHLTLPTWWSAAIEQCGKHVGPIIGLMNMVGIIGGMCALGCVGRVGEGQKARGLSGREQWDPIFYVYIVGLLLVAMLWLGYRKQPWSDSAE
ncbi:MAG: MFS transporter [Planctomycetota bacterium]|nr:MFS transporter [Planctomycetota bacterium]